MKVSVIIPAHNEEKFIAETLKAVLAQDYPNYEVIVVDNASTDKTSEIVSAFPEVKLIYEGRKGLLWARECGRINATGDILVNTDADCIPDSDWLSQGVSKFTGDHIVAVTGPCYFHDAGPVFRRATFKFQRTVYPLFNSLFQLMRVGAVLIGGNTFIRAKALKEIGGYNTKIVFYGEDTDTAKRLSKKGKIKFKNDVVTNTSSRRFVAEGTWETLFLYIFNFFWVTFFKNPHQRIKLRTKEIFSNITK
jgi:glycosyltransferase involved in cell wall biosynthesis